MKLKNNFIYQNFKYSINNQLYMIVFGLSILFSLFVALSNYNYEYWTSFLLAFNNTFYVIFLLLIILINTKNTFDAYKNNYEYLIRYGDKKNYLKIIVQSVLFNNFVLITFNIILLATFFNFIGTGVNTILVKDYNVSIVLYFMYCVIKFIVLSSIISKLNLYLLYKFNDKIIILLNIVLYCCIYVVSTFFYGISSITKIPLFIGAYLISLNTKYSSFFFEILCFFIYALSIYILINVISKIILRRKSDI